MIPFYKILSLFIRNFSKPIVNYAKKIPTATGASTIGGRSIRRFFIFFGNSYHTIDVIISRSLLKMNQGGQQAFIKPLTEEMAIQKGAELFSEVLFYSIVLGIPIYELYIAQIQSEQKKETYNQKLEQIEQSIEETKNTHQQIQEVIKYINQVNIQINHRLQFIQTNLSTKVIYDQSNFQLSLVQQQYNETNKILEQLSTSKQEIENQLTGIKELKQ